MESGPGGKVTLPRWVQLFFMGVAEAPWTNLKSLNSLAATNATLIYLAFAAPLGWKLEEWLVNSVFILLGSWLGISGLGSFGKRMTYKPGPPNQPDIEDAAAGATIDPAKPGAGSQVGARDPRLPSALDDERGD